MKISLEKSAGATVAVRVEITPEMLSLAKRGARLSGASAEQVLLWAFAEGVASFESFILEGTLEDAAEEAHGMVCVVSNIGTEAIAASAWPLAGFN